MGIIVKCFAVLWGMGHRSDGVIFFPSRLVAIRTVYGIAFMLYFYGFGCVSLSHILLVALVPSHKFSQSIGEYAHNPWRKYKSQKEAPKQPFMRSQECKEAERENQDH